MPRKDAYGGPISAQAQQDLVSEGIENFELPKSLVMKIAKSSIPDNVKLQKETVLSLVKGSTVFINYLAATAHDVAQSRQHKSISASDVLKALEILQFGDITGRLQSELAIYRETGKHSEPSKSGKKSASGGSMKKVNAATTGSGSSASAPVKGKGKEKATPVSALPPPFTSAPLPMGGTITSEHIGDHPHGETEPILAPSGVDGDGDPMDVDRWPMQHDEVVGPRAAELEEEDMDEVVEDVEQPVTT